MVNWLDLKYTSKFAKFANFISVAESIPYINPE